MAPFDRSVVLAVSRAGARNGDDALVVLTTTAYLERVADAEVIKFSAGGFRDFTRIAASDPVMWRDVFLNNRDAVLEMLGRFTEDLTALQRAIRSGDGATLHDLFDRTRAIRRSIIDEGQDDALLTVATAHVDAAATT